MPTSVLIEEKVPGQPPKQQYSITLPADRITVRELIQYYVRDHVERFNSSPKFESSKHQAEEEIMLNRTRTPKRAQARDCEAECEKALEGFANNRFFVLIDDKQADDLDQQIAINANSKVCFLQLTQLVGG